VAARLGSARRMSRESGLAVLMAARAEEIHALASEHAGGGGGGGGGGGAALHELCVLWSGGIDSTAAILALMALGPRRYGRRAGVRLVALYAQRSVREFEAFWDRYVVGGAFSDDPDVFASRCLPESQHAEMGDDRLQVSDYIDLQDSTVVTPPRLRVRYAGAQKRLHHPGPDIMSRALDRGRGFISYPDFSQVVTGEHGDQLFGSILLSGAFEGAPNWLFPTARARPGRCTRALGVLRSESGSHDASLCAHGGQLCNGSFRRSPVRAGARAGSRPAVGGHGRAVPAQAAVAPRRAGAGVHGAAARAGGPRALRDPGPVGLALVVQLPGPSRGVYAA
jgi:hypothetical protein